MICGEYVISKGEGRNSIPKTYSERGPTWVSNTQFQYVNLIASKQMIRTDAGHVTGVEVLVVLELAG